MGQGLRTWWQGEILGEVLPGLAHAEPGALEIEGFPRLRRVVVDADDPYAGCLRLADVLDAGADPALDAATPSGPAASA